MTTTDARRVALALAIVATLSLAACGGRVANQPASASKPQRIISLSPSATEILYGVGAFSRVVAVSDYDDYPPEVKNLPRIGGWQNTNLEQVVSLKPDLVVLTQAQEKLIKDKLDALGLRTVVAPDRSLADALASITLIGDAVGEPEAARRLRGETQGRLDEVRARASPLPRPRVLCIVDRVPGTLRGLYAATDGSFIDQLVELAGGDSVAPHSEIG
ncbi:MAG: helical backbone metal receptor, partial [Acidobacteria bacterium]|nr:helical backbone metal receptor [Acidobacteriota bacterium]